MSATVSAERLLRVAAKREVVPRLLQACFDKQVAFITDPSRRKALFVARRSGKTWAVCVLLLITCLSEPATKCLYYGFTGESAWNAIYQHMIEVLCRKFGIQCEVNLTYRTVTFPNGSYIKITGDDASDRQIDKALGGKYKLVVFDECQGIVHDLESWIKHKISPALVDLRGTLVLAGTAGDRKGHHYWYKVTRSPEDEREKGWSVHSWTPFENPHTSEQVREELDRNKRDDPGYDQTPYYHQQWLCQWVSDSEARIYKYDPLRNGTEDFDFNDPAWRYVFGLDFGFEDDTALVVGANHPYKAEYFIVGSYKQKHMSATDIGRVVQEWRAKFKPIIIVGDCQNLNVVEELRKEHRIPIERADKLGKEAHIAMMNADFRSGRIKVVGSLNQALIQEWDGLNWDPKKRMVGIFKENPTKDNHLADAALYAHHRLFGRPKPAPVVDTHPMRTQAERELREQLSHYANGTGPSVYDYLERTG